MIKSFQEIRIELSSRNVRNIYFFSACPKILFDEIIYILKSRLGRNTKILNISQRTSIFSEFFNYDFFSGRKILILDWDLYFPSKQQIKEIISTILKYNEKSDQKNTNFLLSRSYNKQIDKDLYKYVKDSGMIYWVSWKIQDVLSVVKSKFPDVKFLDDSEKVISDMVERNFGDILGAIKKAILYAYPRRYISAKDMYSVFDQNENVDSSSLDLLRTILGDPTSFIDLLEDDKVQQILPRLIQLLLSIVKIKAESKTNGFIDKFRISQELRMKNLDDKTMNSIKSIDESLLLKNLLNLVYKSRIGSFQSSFYMYDFLKRISAKE